MKRTPSINIKPTGLDSFTITGLKAGDLRFLANVLEAGSYVAGRGGPVPDMAVRLAGLFRKAANSHVQVTCAPSTSRPEECYVEIR